MKIVFVSSLSPVNSIGGGEILTFLLAKALARRHHQITIFTGGKEKESIIDGIKIKQIKELTFPGSLKSLFFEIYASKLRKRLIKQKLFCEAEIINATDLDSILGLSGWKEINNRLVAVIQDYGLICPDGDLLVGRKICPNFCHKNEEFMCLKYKKIPFLKKIYFQSAYAQRKKIRDRKLKLLKQTICVSRFIADKLLTVNPHINYQVISNCLPEEWYKMPFGGEIKDIDILYIGKLEPHKGLEVLLISLKSIIKNKNLEVFFIGAGKLKKYQDLSKKLKIDKQVKFIGPVEFKNIHQYYQRARIVIVPSLWPEPCGRVIIEAMFWGVAIIGTNQGGTPELINNNKNGFLIKAGDVNELINKIKYLLDRPKIIDKIGKQGHAFAKNNFSPTSIAKKYEAFYRLLLR